MTFTWQWGGAPRSWRLEVLDEHLEVVLEQDCEETSWELDDSGRSRLEPGGIYYWRVRAVDDDGLRTSPVLFLAAD